MTHWYKRTAAGTCALNSTRSVLPILFVNIVGYMPGRASRQGILAASPGIPKPEKNIFFEPFLFSGDTKHRAIVGAQYLPSILVSQASWLMNRLMRRKIDLGDLKP
jgi:hypothetical protein